jgi:hypothetical protein
LAHSFFMQIDAKLFILTLLLPFTDAAQAGLLHTAPLQSFLQKHCLECHDAETQKGKLNLEVEEVDLTDPATFQRWVKIFERTERGEMPPKLEDRPPATEMLTFLKSLEPQMVSAGTQVRTGVGRTAMRRLNRDQFLHSLQSLIGPADLPEIFSEELPAGAFDTEDRVLGASETQLTDFLKSIKINVTAAVAQLKTAPKTQSLTFPPTALLRKQDIQKFALAIDKKDLIVFLSGGLGIDTLMTHKWSAPSTGWYRVRLLAAAYQSDHPQPILLQVGSVVDFNTMRDVGYEEAPLGEPQWLEYETLINQGEGLRFERADSEPLIFRHTKIDLKTSKESGARYRSIQIHGPYSHSQHEQAPVLQELALQHPDWQQPGKLEPLLIDFARRAYRKHDVAALIQPVLAAAAKASDPYSQLNDALRVLLGSANFLLHQEANGPLTQEQLATRLSYFITTRPPDATLLAKAAAGQLSESITLRSETDRLLKKPESTSLIQRLCDQWFQLNQIAFTDPDEKLCSGWDRHVQDSAIRETRAYLSAMLHENLPISLLIQSDFTFANARLAKLYGKDDLQPLMGDFMQRVNFTPGSPRGGLLTHASVMKVSADGTNSSPILRGLWVKRYLLDEPLPPPPPGIPAVEPDIRGAKTIREQLALHEKSASCASCHRHIDPYGYALESFNPIGQRRLHYTIIDPKKKSGIGKGAAVDPSGVLPDGTEFKSLPELSSHLLKDPDLIARATVRKLIAYSTGHAAEFADRPAISQILDQTRPNGHRLQDILHAIISSPVFQQR